MKWLALCFAVTCAAIFSGGAWAETARPAQSEILLARAAPPSVLGPVERIDRVMGKRRAARRGSVCGDRGIQGEEIGGVPARVPGCGVESAVRITSVAGINLSQSAVMECDTARALYKWTEKSAIPAFKRKGGGLVEFRVAAHYACRTRNNQPGARISEHGKGKAIDISGFVLKNGETISVLKGWNARAHSKAMRKVHKGACGPFGTVLGPQSDRFHQNHFHFDTARHRGGPYCR